jgi:hypothetical protein
MHVTDGDGERVGGIVRRRRRRQAEEQLDHVLHLLFFSAPVADHCPLDFGRRVFDTGRPASTAASIATPRA